MEPLTSEPTFVEHEFSWPLTTGVIRVTGSFCGWSDGMVLKAHDSGFSSVHVPVQTGKAHLYKFVVDGKWLYDSNKPFATDEFGNINNVLFIDSMTGEEVDKSEPEVGLDLGSCPPGFVEPTPMPSEPSDAAASEASDAAAGGDTPSEADLLSPLPQAFVAADAAADRDIAEWLETANGFCAPVVRRRASETPTELAANRELLSEFAINVSNRKTPTFTRSASSTSIATLATIAHPLDSAVGAVEKLTVAQASVRKEGKLILAMVGLPARGKTYIARKLYRHLSWMGYNVCMCNVGNFRRSVMGASQTHDFFDPKNEEAVRQRHKLAQYALDEMMKQLVTGADIGIYDATNSSTERRAWLRESVEAHAQLLGLKYKLVFVEIICTDEKIIASNVRETKLKSPDYKHMDEATAVEDFLKRIQHYVSAYESLDEAESVPYIKLIDVGRQLITNRLTGYLNGRILFFLQNINIAPRPIWISRHGESEFNVKGLIGGDSSLSPRGIQYAQKLAAFMNKHYPPGTDLTVWTSTLRRTVQTASYLGREIVQWKGLDEIDAGVCDGMTYEQIAEKMPEEYAARSREKFSYRYPRGESYQDIVHRLEPVIIELMRQQGPVLIVSHQATLRVLYAYLTFHPPAACPELLMPLHTTIQLTPRAYGCEEVRHALL